MSERQDFALDILRQVRPIRSRASTLACANLYVLQVGIIRFSGAFEEAHVIVHVEWVSTHHLTVFRSAAEPLKAEISGKWPSDTTEILQKYGYQELVHSQC